MVKDAITPEYTVNREINADGTVASETRNNSLDLRTTFLYDDIGRLEHRTPPAGNAVTTTYSPSQILVEQGSSAVATDLDGFGRPIGTSNSVGIKTRIEYTTEGYKRFESYPFTVELGEHGITFEYDVLGRVKVATDPANKSRSWTYNDDHSVTIRDELGRETVQRWQAFGDPDVARLAVVTPPAAEPGEEGQTTSYEYDVLGKLRFVRHGPTGPVREWTYNQNRLLETETHSESGTTTYTYDAAGNIRTRTNAKAKAETYTYDGNDRVRHIDVTDYTGGDGHYVSFVYDAFDNKREMITPWVSTSFDYVNNRLMGRTDAVRDTDGVTATFTTGYDYVGDDVSKVTYPSGLQVRYSYDSEHRITRIDDPHTNDLYADAFDYHPSGAIKAYRAGNGLTHSISYDSRYRPQDLNAGGKLSLRYGYDDAGNVTSIEEFTRPHMNQTFTYDGLDRLRVADGFWDTGEFRYDDWGNRTYKKIGADETSYAYSSMRLHSATGAEAAEYGYQANGNLETQSAPTPLTFTYTPFDMLETANSGAITTYRYDADNIRKLKSLLPAPNHRYYVTGVGGQLLAEYVRKGTKPLRVDREYVYAGSRLIASLKSAYAQYFGQVTAPASGTTVRQPFEVRGWAIDKEADTGTGISEVALFARPLPDGASISLGTATYGLENAEVAAQHGEQFRHSGYTKTVRRLAGGQYHIDALATSTETGESNMSSVAVTVLGAAPQIVIDVPSASGRVEEPFAVMGWAADVNANESAGTGMTDLRAAAFLNCAGAPIPLPPVVTGDARPDVGTTYGAQFANAGYHVTVTGVGLRRGTYCIDITGTSAVSEAPTTTRLQNLFVNASDPYLVIDAPVSGSTLTQPFTLGGWVVDLGADQPPGIDAVKVYRSPPGQTTETFVLDATYGGARPDIAALYGSGYLNSGFGAFIGNLPTGTHQLSVRARSTKTQTFTVVASMTVIVNGASDPQVTIASPASGATISAPFTVSGSARDLGAGAGTGVDVVDLFATLSGGTRQPLGRATYDGTTGAFTFQVTALARGQYDLEAVAHSLVSGANTSHHIPIIVNGASTPITTIDAPPADSTQVQPFHVGGWAIDTGAAIGTGVDALHVYATPAGGGATIFLGAAYFAGSRPDVGAAYGEQFAPSGYGLSVRGLAPGPYQIIVYARSTVTGVFHAATRDVTVLADPRTAIEAPPPGAVLGQPFTVSGWAVDLAAASGTGVSTVDVAAYLNGGGPAIELGAATYGAARPDRETAFGPQFRDSGFSLTANGLATGTYRLDVRARSSVSHAVHVHSVTVSVNSASNPLMVVELPIAQSTMSQPFTVGGWAIDRGAAASTGVDRVDADATLVATGVVTSLGTATYGGARPDVGAAYGSQYTNSGYGLSAGSLAPGVYDVTIKARSTLTGVFTTSAATRVTVNGPTDPRLTLEAPPNNAVLGPTFTVSGYAVDLGAGDGTGVSAVRVLASPASGAPVIILGDATYGLARTDVGAAHGSRFTNSGYSYSVSTVPRGQYALEVQAWSTVQGTYSVSVSVRHPTMTVNGTSTPLVVLDAPVNGATLTQAFTIGGWAIDRGAAVGTGVDLVTASATMVATGAVTPLGTTTTAGRGRTSAACTAASSRRRGTA